jgi:hypothetical protein
VTGLHFRRTLQRAGDTVSDHVTVDVEGEDSHVDLRFTPRWLVWLVGDRIVMRVRRRSP